MRSTPAFMANKIMRLTLWIVLAACSGASAFAGGWAQPEGRLFLKMYGGVYTAGSYYDRSGELVTDVRQTLTQPADTVQRRVQVANEFDAVVGGLYGEYGVTPELTLIVDVPVAHIQLLRRAQYSEQNPNGARSYRVDTLYSLTAPAYYGVGARYRIGSTEKLQACITASVFVPSGFDESVVNTSDSFLSDGAMQVRGGVELGIPASFGWVALHGLYNWRGEELEDEILFRAEAGFNKVENAFFKFHVDAVQSVASFGDSDFTPSRTLLQESYVAAGASFSLFFTKSWFVDVDYNVRILGTNTWNLSTVVLGTGIVIDDL